jgi:hypothetical protein
MQDALGQPIGKSLSRPGLLYQYTELPNSIQKPCRLADNGDPELAAAK